MAANHDEARERQRIANLRWRRRNRASPNGKGPKYERRKRGWDQAPKWERQAMHHFYRVARRYGFEVDHVVPLGQGGEHRLDNLQMLAPSTHAKKSSRERRATKPAAPATAAV